MTRIDPLLNHHFIVNLIDTSSTLATLGSIASTPSLGDASAGFSECSGIELTMQPEEYKEGGRNGAVLKFPSRVTWTNLTLKRGIAVSTDLWDWHYSFVTGQGTRRDGMITLLDEQRQPNRIWYFTRGLPVKYTASGLNAMQNQVVLETVEIAHEGLYEVGGLGTFSGVVGAIAAVVG